ncbi:MAG TPA: tetratricopeptide repeat protein, partial [Vicinamibacterales bacterium]
MFAAPGARVLRRVVPIVLLVTLAGCAARRAVPPPATPLYPAFEFPGLETPLPGVTEDVMARHQDGWNLLQSGQPGAAARVFTSILEKTPAFYPAKAALGYTALAHRNYDAAIGAFDAVLAQAPKYLPALSGRADALLAANRPVEAIKALEALIAADPSRTAAKTQLESLRLGAIESLVA